MGSLSSRRLFCDLDLQQDLFDSGKPRYLIKKPAGATTLLHYKCMLGLINSEVLRVSVEYIM